MLEGLEVTTKLFSELFNKEHDTFRIDSEHYQKKYLFVKKLLENCEHEELLNLIEKPVMTGHTPSMKVDSYYGGDVKFIKTDNLRENSITDNFSHYLSKSGNEIIKRSSLKVDDIIVTIIGATYEIVGRSTIIFPEHLPANINQNIALIRADKSLVNPHYLNIFLNTKYGRNILYYHSRQTEQVNLNCREVERAIVPIFSRLESLISKVFLSANHITKQYQEIYKNAEKILLEESGLSDFNPSDKNINIKDFSESFALSGRLDAEYYQPKYEDYLNVIQSYGQGYEPLSTACNLKDENFNPDDRTQYNYIELSNIGKSGDITGSTLSEGLDLPSRARRKVSFGDVVISSIEGSLESCGLVTQGYDNALCSTGFYVLNSKKSILKRSWFCLNLNQCKPFLSKIAQAQF